jgi:pyruvate/2-oxoglutarate/acetoin dehydrogenase E1 component/TPP-dependent pyruvate/acetoin dehydrogenase alpha subunit
VNKSLGVFVFSLVLETKSCKIFLILAKQENVFLKFNFAGAHSLPNFNRTRMLDQLIIQEPVDAGRDLSPEEIVKDFEICCISREVSLLARKEVLTGKAKFGIIGDGKEVPQVAMARSFQKGDWRSGYYRDQTLMFALGLSTVEEFFAQLYADPDNDPFSGGRQMNSHFATPTVDEEGNWLNHKSSFNISSDISSTGGQMARSLGLALASKHYRQTDLLKDWSSFSKNGEEVCFCTIGDASTSEGIFWETVNAAGVQQVPLAISVWDDGYGISVPIEYQTTKGSISEVLSGFEATKDKPGLAIHKAKAWDYPTLVKTYAEGIRQVREQHQPALFHITEVTQPQGHSTSGSHERYKSKERLQWEKDNDCILKMEQWMIEQGYFTAEDAKAIRKKAKKYVKECRDQAWKAINVPIKSRFDQLKELFEQIPADNGKIDQLRKELNNLRQPSTAELTQLARRALYQVSGTGLEVENDLVAWIQQSKDLAHKHYHTHLYSDTPQAALNVPVVLKQFEDDAPQKNGYEILNMFFDHALEQHPELCAFGEDVGQIGDVNQGFANLQKKHGEERVFDTGIREWSIMGQAIGMAMRGLRPIAEIQYLDYLIYGLEPLMDDLATLRWRSNGIQKAPAIIRTRGHRLEGIWHAGSPLGMILNAIRGIYVLVPRDMVQAAGFYNTMLQSDDPAIIIECLNGYRLKERLPSNLGQYTVPLGVPEVLQEGRDVTLVTYGSCVRVAQEGIAQLEEQGISVELIDVESLLPFDLEHRIVESLKKTNRVVFMDEDVPGGATAFMMREVLEQQGGYRFLDSAPQTITAREHRPPYGSNGDYFSKPNPEDVFETIYNIMHEASPADFPVRY